MSRTKTGGTIEGTPAELTAAFQGVHRMIEKTARTEATATTTEDDGQQTIPGVPTKRDVLKDSWEQIEALREAAVDLLGTARKGAASTRTQTQECAAVLAKVAAAILDGARKMEKLLTADDE